MAKKILTIDDQTDVRRLIRMTLEFEGHEVIEACDGEQGMQIARTQRPDLIFLDIRMPGRDGIAICEAIHQDAQLSSIPVILLTGTVSQLDLSEIKIIGAKECLTKPYDPMYLLDLVDKYTR